MTSLRAARTARGWSQTDAANRVVALATTRGLAVAAAASLKTQLSRWENGHSLPDQPYRELLGEIYDRTPEELGITGTRPGAAGHIDTTGDHGPFRLRAAMAEADAAGRAGAELWWEQLTAAGRLDDELGAAGAGGLVDAQIERLTDTVLYTVAPGPRAATAAVLAAATALGAAQSLDRGWHDLAWQRYDQSLAAARQAGSAEAEALAVTGQAEVLVDAGDPGAALALLDLVAPSDDGVSAVRIAAATALAAAATGDRAAATGAFATAERRWKAVTVDAVTPPAWMRVELADLHRWHGHVLLQLGDESATGPLTKALDARQRSTRDRAAVHADLATALRAQRPDDAAEHAATARELATSIGSERIAARLSR